MEGIIDAMTKGNGWSEETRGVAATGRLIQLLRSHPARTEIVVFTIQQAVLT